MDSAYELNKVSTNYINMIESSCKNSSSLEGFLHKAHSFYPYSTRYVALILSQNPNATECHGADEWKARGAYIKAVPHAIQIYAPTPSRKGNNGGEMQFNITSLIDISDTNVKKTSHMVLNPNQVLELFNTIALKKRWELVYTDAFKPTYKKATYLDWQNRKIFVNQGENSTIQAWMVIKEYALIKQQEDIQRGKRSPLSLELSNAMALASAFEVLDYLGCCPSLLPSRAKAIILDDNSVKFVNKLKDIHKSAIDIIREIKDLIAKNNKK